MEKTSFKTLIDSAQSVLILLPTKPFFDQVAAGLSLYLALEKNKNASINCPADMVVEFNRLVGVNKISKELGDKNLVIGLKDYDAQNIERVTYDIVNDEFKLSVIPKPSFAPPKRDQIAVTYSGLSSDLVILIGGGNESHFPALTKNELASAKIAHIGTHDVSNTTNKKIFSLSRTSSSTSEIVAGLIKELGVSFDPDIASNLLAGIAEGSKNFTTSYVTANTFEVASELMKAGGKYESRDNSRKDYTPRDFGQNTQEALSEKKEVKSEPVLEQEDKKEEAKEENTEEAPKAWLEPKIYKGSTGN